jgi:hypothetical protein
MNSSAEPAAPRFCFERDTFGFANELVWEYRPDPVSGEMRTRRNDPPPTYAHHCFVVARSARQFLYHARFDPAAPAPDDAAGRRLIRRVVARSPRHVSPAAERVVIPGYDGLRSFSLARERLLKESCGGAWQSYCLRSHWRMVFPISRDHQQRTATRLAAGLRAGGTPIVHLVRFPQLTINHGMLIFGMEPAPEGIRFAAYDPNLPGRPVELLYTHADLTFTLPPNHYWAGGRVDLIEIFRGWIY